MSTDYDSWVASLTIVGDEAYGPGERTPRNRRLSEEERATYKRDWMRRFRAANREEQIAAGAYVIEYGSLHDIGCSGPTRATGHSRRCNAVPLYRKPTP